jgi:N-acetylglucosaminyl-diphospho-decaprenol L-rhamnosyltransferase
MVLSIIIVSWNTRQDLLECLESIFASPPRGEFEVVVVDNASSDGSAEAVAGLYPLVRLIRCRENMGFARANNRAAAVAAGQYWLLLNPDTIVHPGAIDRLVQYVAERPRAAGVGPRLVNPDGSLQLSIWRMPNLIREWWRLFHLDRLYPLSEYPSSTLTSRLARRVEVLHGACLLLRCEALRGLGLFDEDYFVYSEEIDLCDRLGHTGWELYWVPEAVVTHKGGQSTRQVADAMFVELYRNKVKFFRKRRGRIASLLYKVILLQAALTRYLVGQAMRPLRLRGHNQWIDTARQYRMLIVALPGL